MSWYLERQQAGIFDAWSFDILTQRFPANTKLCPTSTTSGAPLYALIYETKPEVTHLPGSPAIDAFVPTEVPSGNRHQKWRFLTIVLHEVLQRELFGIPDKGIHGEVTVPLTRDYYGVVGVHSFEVIGFRCWRNFQVESDTERLISVADNLSHVPECKVRTIFVYTVTPWCGTLQKLCWVYLYIQHGHGAWARQSSLKKMQPMMFLRLRSMVRPMKPCANKYCARVSVQLYVAMTLGRCTCY